MRVYTRLKRNNRLIPLTSYNDKMLCRDPKGYKWLLVTMTGKKRLYAEILTEKRGRLIWNIAGNCEIMRTQREQAGFVKMDFCSQIYSGINKAMRKTASNFYKKEIESLRS